MPNVRTLDCRPLRVLFPGIEGAVAERATAAGMGRVGAKLAGLAAAGAPAGAADTPNDRVAGALAGSLLAPIFGVAHEGVTRGAGAVAHAASIAANDARSLLAERAARAKTIRPPSGSPDGAIVSQRGAQEAAGAPPTDIDSSPAVEHAPRTIAPTEKVVAEGQAERAPAATEPSTPDDAP